jgi:hypothetical protein
MTTLHSNLHSGRADSGQERTLKGSYYNWGSLGFALREACPFDANLQLCVSPSFSSLPHTQSPILYGIEWGFVYAEFSVPT